MRDPEARASVRPRRQARSSLGVAGQARARGPVWAGSTQGFSAPLRKPGGGATVLLGPVHTRDGACITSRALKGVAAGLCRTPSGDGQQLCVLVLGPQC